MYQEQSTWKKGIEMEKRESADEKFLGVSVATACSGRTVLTTSFRYYCLISSGAQKGPPDRSLHDWLCD